MSVASSGLITNWNWNFGDGNSSINQNPTNTYANSGAYSVTLSITSDLGCVDDSLIQGYIIVHDLAVADFTFSPSFGAPQDIISLTNTSTNAVGYKWYFGDGDSSSIQNPIHVYKDEGVFVVTLIAMSPYGCNDTTEYSIAIKSDNFYAPNSFTPSEDGKNDEWRIIGVADVREYSLQIYNRWGEIIFETKDETKSWDGKYLGVLCPPDVYVWKVKFKRTGTEVYEYKGHINLVR